MEICYRSFSENVHNFPNVPFCMVQKNEIQFLPFCTCNALNYQMETNRIFLLLHITRLSQHKIATNTFSEVALDSPSNERLNYSIIKY